jgi:formate dehydrogenase subunit gamma
MISAPPGLVERYVPAQRLVHWVGVLSFLLLLSTGIILLFRPLAFLAAGGVTRLVHRFAAVPFVALPFLYTALLPRHARELVAESFAYGREDWQWLRRMPSYFLGSAQGLPPQGRLNAGQKIHHAGTFLMFVTVSASGIVLWFWKGHLGARGLAAAAAVHDLSMLGLSVLMAGHVYFTFLYDALSAMRTGYVTEEYARMEHQRWFASLPRERHPAGPTDPEHGGGRMPAATRLDDEVGG